jgi:hypothetical protein
VRVLVGVRDGVAVAVDIGVSVDVEVRVAVEVAGTVGDSVGVEVGVVGAAWRGRQKPPSMTRLPPLLRPTPVWLIVLPSLSVAPVLKVAPPPAMTLDVIAYGRPLCALACPHMSVANDSVVAESQLTWPTAIRRRKRRTALCARERNGTCGRILVNDHHEGGVGGVLTLISIEGEDVQCAATRSMSIHTDIVKG